MNPSRNKIYFFVTDRSTPEDFLQNLKKYCEAFYTGLKVEIMYPKTAKTSVEFFEELGVTSRDGFFGKK